MNNALYVISFLFLFGVFIATEFVLSPPENISSAYIEEEAPQEEVEEKTAELNFLALFQKLGIEDVQKSSVKEAQDLFYKVRIPPETGFKITTEEFFTLNEIQEPEKFVVIYSIFSLEEEPIETTFNRLKEYTQHYFANDVETRIEDSGIYEGKNFMIRLEENQKTMYLVVVSHDRLLGFAYPLDDNLRYESIKKVLSALSQR